MQGEEGDDFSGAFGVGHARIFVRIPHCVQNKVAASALFFYSPSMSWTEFILQWTASQIMEWTGAPKRTVYDWRNGAAPPEWLQPILAAHVTRQMKKHNK